MSITTMRRMWPADRYKRFVDLRNRARKSGLSVTVGNYGRRGMPMFSIEFSGEADSPAKHFDIEAAEGWLDAYETQQTYMLGGSADGH